MASVSVSISSAQMAQLKSALSPKQIRQATFQAVKRTTEGAVVDVRKVLKDKTTISQKYVQRAISAKKPTGDPPVGSIKISQFSLPAVAYKHTASKKSGATITPVKGKKPIVVRHAFKTKVGKGQHAGIFLRAKGRTRPRLYKGWWGKNSKNRKDRMVPGKLTKRGFTGGLPIEQVRVPSVLNLVSKDVILPVILAGIEARLQKNIDSQISRFIK